jgi:hypothetical protein
MRVDLLLVLFDLLLHVGDFDIVLAQMVLALV